MENRERPKQMKFRFTENEKAMILNNGEKLGFKTFANYARKMLIDGYVINLKWADDDLKKLIAEVSRIGNNINQMYECDLEEIKQGQQKIVNVLRQQVINNNKIKKFQFCYYGRNCSNSAELVLEK